MKHETDTSSNFLFPAGHYEQATILGVEKKDIPGGYVIYEWEFQTDAYTGKIGLFSSGMGELLKALGADEHEPNKFIWDDDDVVGKSVSFTVEHSTDKKGKTRASVMNVTAVAGPVKAWDADIPPSPKVKWDS